MHVITSMCALNHSNHCGLCTEEPTATRENERSSRASRPAVARAARAAGARKRRNLLGVTFRAGRF